MSFIVITVVEREIFHNAFDEEKDAIAYMKHDLEKEMASHDVHESLVLGVDNGDYGFNSLNAYSNLDDDYNIDWAIIQVN